MKKKKKLKPTWEKFCAYYIATGNATESYMKAFNKTKTSKKKLNNYAHDLMQLPEIKERLNELQQKLETKTEKQIEDIGNELGKTIASKVQVLQELTEIALNSDNEMARLRALELLGKFHRIFGDTASIEVNNNNFAPVQLVVKYVNKEDVVHEIQQ